MMVQTEVRFVLNNADANDQLREYQVYYPKRRIINVNLVPAVQAGWFMTIVYSVEV